MRPLGANSFWQVGGPVFGHPLGLFVAAFVFGEDPAWVDLVYADVVLPHERVAEVAREGHERALGDRVGEEVFLAAIGIDAADVDDRAAGGGEMRQRRP